MTPFLRQVARHYIGDGAGNISRLCFIFPNRRAMRFFASYLGKEIAAAGTGPLVAPAMYTMSDFVCAASGLRVTPRVDLLLELYPCYKALNPHAEPLDDFIFWGDALLGDFDDVDKYLVPAADLFRNVSDLRALQDDLSYLSDAQREAIGIFMRHFLTPGEVKERFLGIWNLLLPLYTSFREALASKGMGYEGMIYRQLAERLQTESVADVLGPRFPGADKFVFVGLNALNECEKVLLRRLHRAGLAEFCWDWQSEAIRNPDNKSSVFLGAFTTEFPSAFTPDPEGLPQTEFNVLSVPGGIAQAKLLPQILNLCTPDPAIETAVVLPDENLLIPVLGSIPSHVQKLNVTMGYPIGGSQMGALISELGSLQMHLRSRGGQWLFYHRPFWALLSNPVVRCILDQEILDALSVLRARRRYYISTDELPQSPVLSAIFRPVAVRQEADPAQVRELCVWLLDVVVAIALRLKDIESMQLELDFAKAVHETVLSMQARELPLLPASFFRLLGQILASATAPFKGEPLQGLQIMGPLELRALDFDNLIILSFNEGMFPRRSVSASFIPPELRKGFGLPTYEYQDAVWAYYFYRAIQRAGKVWMVYDSRTEGLKGGEPSRYLRQLQMHFGVNVRNWEALLPIGNGPADTVPQKTAEQLLRLHEGTLSASSVRTYLDCPAKFYYSKVEGLKAEKELTESLDSSMLGNVLHRTMQELYPAGTLLTKDFCNQLRADKQRIRAIIARNICEELGTIEVSGRNIVFADIVEHYADAILAADASAPAPIRIIGTEKKKTLPIGGFNFIGFIDRLDSPAPGQLRVVDYKTGRVRPEDLDFDAKGNVPHIGLQLYIYKLLLGPQDTPVTGAIYQPAQLISGKGVLSHPLDDSYCTRIGGALQDTLAEISDLSVPWNYTPDVKKCEYCDFRAICRR